MLHQLGYCHNDIKPDNILLFSGDYSRSESSILTLIDFSAAQRYLEDDGTHVKTKKSSDFNGNFAYSSKYHMMGFSRFALSYPYRPFKKR